MTDLFDGDIRRKARAKCIDFVFTTRSRSLITEFASRNKAWHVVEKNEEEIKEAERVHSHINPLADMANVRMEEIEAYHQSSTTRKVLHGKMNLLREKTPRDTLLLTPEDQRVGFNKSPRLKFHK